MSKEDIFQAMKKEIEETSQKQIDSIMLEVKKMEDDAIKSMQLEAKNDADRKLKQEVSQIQLEASNETTESSTKRKRKLISQREDYMNTIFSEARKKLVDYVSSDDYVSYLKKKYEEVKTFDIDEAIIYIREDDVSYQHLFDDTVKVSQDIKIGGFMVEDIQNHIIYNYTLDFALENQKEWFIKHSGLVIQ